MTESEKGLKLHFSGEYALVTGAASGIGSATVKCLLECGLTVLALDVNPAQQISVGTAHAIPLTADVRYRERIEAELKLGGHAPDYVVNCAGVLDPTGFHGVSEDAFSRVLNINLVGAYNVIDVASQFGNLKSVVNVTSIESSRVVALSDPDPHPAYAASKAAMKMLTKTAARALSGTGARVNAVAPGFVLTAMASEHTRISGELPDALSARVPMNRFAEPLEIANAIAFLLSDEAGFITGAELLADGGFSLT